MSAGVRHVVLVRFKAGADAGEIAAIMRELADLKDHIEGMLDFQAGPNVSPEGMGRGYGHAFTIDFADVAARDRYLADEDHARAGARLTEAADGGRDGLLVFDLLLS